MENILHKDSTQPQQINPNRRRELLPWWIKIFIWIFFIFTAMVPIGLIASLIGYSVPSELYGMGTDSPFSIVGLLVYSFFLLKGVVSFGLWTQKDWALNVAQIDAIIGLIACVFVSFGSSLLGDFGIRSGFRLEIFLLIPYLIKVRDLMRVW